MILAAGAGRRMGGAAKALITLDGVPLVRHILNAFAEAGIDELLVVTGAHSEAVEEAVRAWDSPQPEGCRVECVHNARWSDGQAGSVSVAVQTAQRRGSTAVLITPVDLPALSPRVIERMATIARGPALPCVTDGPDRVPTHPARIDASDFEAVLHALEVGPADRGAGPWLQQVAAQHVLVDDLIDRAPTDLDTPADLQEVRSARWCRSHPLRLQQDDRGQ